MSIIPYNSNNEIVYHDSSRGIILSHDEEQNSLQLLTTIDSNSDQSSNSRNYGDSKFNHSRFKRRASSTSSIKCPNCGFSWENLSTSSTNNSELSNKLMSSFSVSDTSTTGVNSQLMIMHHEYFKYLGRIASPQQQQLREEETLPKNIFNQGYFDRFFKKVFPYELGSGARAKVYKVVHVLNDIKIGTFAVKRISIGDKMNYLEQVLNEVLILYELSVNGANENNLIRYNHVWIEMGDINDSSTYIVNQNDDSSIPSSLKIPYVFILQQYCDGGHLEDLIRKNYQIEDQLSSREQVERERKNRRKTRIGSNIRNVSPVQKKTWLSSLEIFKFFRDIVRGVNYLHFHGILHRDLKPSNCLLESKYSKNLELNGLESNKDLEDNFQRLPRVLVSDFGEGKFIDKRQLNLNTKLSDIENEFSADRKGNTGTLEFTAPELWVLAAESNNMSWKRYANDFTFDSDVYALGLILCFLCTGELPFTYMVTGIVDPAEIKKLIMSWYLHLTQQSFQSWFMSSKKSEETEYDNKINIRFAELIFAMIKGENHELNESNKRLSCSEVLIWLDKIKSEVILEEKSLTDERQIAELDEKEVVSSINKISDSGTIKSNIVYEINLNSDEQRGRSDGLLSSERSLYSERVNFPLQNIKFSTKDLILMAIYFCNLVGLEIMTMKTAESIHSILKLISLFSIISDLTYLKHNRYRYHLLALNSALTLAFIFKGVHNL